MTIDRWSSMKPSSSPRPQVAPGTPCMPCKARGHHCNAFEIVGGRAVCMYCLDGVDCPRTPRNGVVDAPKPRAPMVTVTLPPSSPQPALAPGAEPSPAMPARRVFTEEPKPVRKPAPYKGKVEARARAKSMLASGMSLKATMAATGLCKGTVSTVRKELPGLPRAGKGGAPRKAADMSAAAAERVVVEAEAITAQVAAEIAGRSVGAGMGEQMGSRMSTVVAPSPDDSAKEALNEWMLVEMSSVPDYRTRSVYDDAVRLLQAAPVGKAMKRIFANADIAETFAKGIYRRAKEADIAVATLQDGATIYVWRREKAGK